MRMRTIPQAVKEIQRADPGTALTVKGLRRLVSEGKIDVVTVGNKRLINLDGLQSELYRSTDTPPPQINMIRRVV